MGSGCSVVVRGKKRNFAVGSPKNSADKRFVYFAKIGFGVPFLMYIGLSL